MAVRNEFNSYEIHGDVATIFITYKGENINCLVDSNDIAKLVSLNYHWFLLKQPKRNTCYVVSNRRRGEPMIRLHRFLTNAPSHMVVDHIDGDGLNNTSKNLRICTRKENSQNIHGARIDNKTSFQRNICWDKSRDKWMVRTKGTFIGRYKNIAEASEAAIKSRRDLMPFSSM